MGNLNLNKVILGGRLTADPELKQTPSGISVVTFTLAVNRKTKERESEPLADFIEVTAWRQTAEFIAKYFRKASCIAIVGSITTRMWTAKDGSNRKATGVQADEAYFVDSRFEADAIEDAKSQATPHFEEIKNSDDLPF